jgi:hypothetical protein
VIAFMLKVLCFVLVTVGSLLVLYANTDFYQATGPEESEDE